MYLIRISFIFINTFSLHSVVKTYIQGKPIIYQYEFHRINLLNLYNLLFCSNLSKIYSSKHANLSIFMILCLLNFKCNTFSAKQ